MTWRDRLLSIPNHPGAWGKFLVCIYLAGWTIAVWIDSPAMTQWPPIRIYVDAIGRYPFATILTIASFAPVAATAYGKFWPRILATSLLMCTWIALFLSSAAHYTSFRPAMMTCVAGVAAAFNSLVRLVERWGLDDGT